jgi:hypothetical protein
MRVTRIFIILGFISLASLGSVFAQALDISSGGTPSITGSLNGSISGNTSVTQDLSFNINFGELSPLNPNNVIKATIPIAIRSNQPYQVSVLVVGAINVNPQAFQRSDIGFGANNMRRMGPQARLCTQSQHIFYSPFNQDPSQNVSFDSAGRATYPASLNNIGVTSVLLSGPRLSGNNNPNRQGNDAWVFDAIFAVTPQYFVAGTTSATVTFTITPGPAAPC